MGNSTPDQSAVRLPGRLSDSVVTLEVGPTQLPATFRISAAATLLL